ncbi:hypothetical protein AURDEDRAFT_74033 [Auricularia subglabra TFB-10046 SS5]|nr:hypothetical protein AURDEDRAFT_74033 [Auricularia subglabra TFB-10046 SS5]
MSLPYAAAHHLSPATQGVPQVGHRECDQCGKMESNSEGIHLLVCGGCKFAAYCSKACQKEHWPSHKPICRFTVATVGASRAEGRFAGGQYPTPNLAKYLRKFCSVHTTLLGWAAYQALALKRNPRKLQTTGLLLELTYAPSAPLRFKLQDHHIIPRAFLAKHADPLVIEEVNRREARARSTGGVGCAVILVQCGNMAEVMPVEFDHPDRLPWADREDWDDVLEWSIMVGRGGFTPPLIQ